ncbi:MFS transporter [Thermoanaerobacter wiegelii]|uniref:Major facilitator superfamily MFS_1 n=1 Tax=Thermoanaerobacter wiegelii Rt8.B1 TaxID=697303 RepID=G2MRS2_9THEO|nr:MFS transporter [Thermoanaerobacter wiegelii]AEM79803.1 major facilitator superfamily MFS_1 [Thermoanaerobacter wiegelii Rt8.B1]
MKNNRFFVLFMYSLGYLGISIFTQTAVKWYQYYYTPPAFNTQGLKMLVPISLIGFSMIVARIFDGISDPIVAYYSDKLNTKMGRRIPFVLFGSPVLMISFIMIWFPPVSEVSIVNFVYLTFVLSLFFVSFTAVVAPYLALIPEITKDAKERIILTMMQGITQIIGVMVAEAGSGILISIFNFKVMGIILGIFAFITLMLTPIFVKEEKIEEENIPTVGMFTSIKMTLANADFMYYLTAATALWFGINTLTIAMPYITEVLLKTPAEDSGFMIAGAFVVAVLFSFFVPKLTLLYGKKKLLMVFSIIFAFILTLTGLFGTVFNKTVSIIIILLAGIPLSVFFVVPNAMIADIAELDGIKTGQRREGMFFGAQGFIIKIVIGISSLVTPLLFKIFGYNAENPLGLQLCGPLAGAIIILSLMVLNKYSLTEKELERYKLESKK